MVLERRNGPRRPRDHDDDDDDVVLVSNVLISRQSGDVFICLGLVSVLNFF